MKDPNLFYKFLELNKVKDQFIYDYETQAMGSKNHMLFVSLREHYEIMTLAFDWSATKHGFNFWHDISIKWNDYCSTILTKKGNTYKGAQDEIPCTL